MDRIQRLIALVKPFYADSNDPAHDWPHIGRVAALARKLAPPTVDLECLLAAVYCHDLINLPKNHPERKEASAKTAEVARAVLLQCDFTEREIELIQSCIVEHSFSRGLKASSPESGILQDADRLDALGAIGILRCTAVNTALKCSFYDPQDPLAENRELDDKRFMVDHYFVKLFKLPELMNTEAGHREGIRRRDYMKSFLAELMQEVR